MPIGWFKRLVAAAEMPPPAEHGILEAIERSLDALGDRAEFVAAFAALLVRVAYADEDVSEAEAERVGELVATHAEMSSEEAAAIAAVARHHTVTQGGGAAYRLTRRFNELARDEDKRHLIDCLYAVATADDLVSHVEDREISRIAAAILLSRSQVLEIRSRYREKLEELQELRRLRSRGSE